MGLDCRIVAPKGLHPEKELVDEVKKICKETGGKITITDNVAKGVKDADVLYTDVWASMGEEAKMQARIKLLKPYKSLPSDENELNKALEEQNDSFSDLLELEAKMKLQVPAMPCFTLQKQFALLN